MPWRDGSRKAIIRGGSCYGIMIDICIPTYNRADKLQRLLRALAEQNDERYRVIVIDNASTDATREVVTAAASMWPAGRMITHRNRINVGGNANILRCLEKAESEWAWIIGDDDIPEPGALARVAMALAENPQAILLNFATTLLDHSGVVRPSPRITTGLHDFIEAIDCFSNTLFLSANVFRPAALVPYLRFGYQEIGTCAPHLVVLLACLADNPTAQVVFSPVRNAVWESPQPDESWAHRPVFMALPRLALLVREDAPRQKLLAAIGRATFDRFPLNEDGLLGVVGGQRDALADQARHFAGLASVTSRHTLSLLKWALLLAIADGGGRKALNLVSRFWPWRTARDAEPERGAVAEMLGSDRL